MECPVCHSENNKVIDSKSQKDKIRRRRQCSDCGTRFFTEETIVTDDSNSIDTSFESMYTMADMAKTVAIAEAIQAIAALNDLAERTKIGIFPFSEIPVLSPDDDSDGIERFHKAAIVDDNLESAHYLSVVADMCIMGGHHDIISYFPEVPGLGEIKAELNDDGTCLYASLTGTTLEAIIGRGRWYLA